MEREKKTEYLSLLPKNRFLDLKKIESLHSEHGEVIISCYHGNHNIWVCPNPYDKTLSKLYRDAYDRKMYSELKQIKLKKKDFYNENNWKE
jgi:hypothetical protein